MFGLNALRNKASIIRSSLIMSSYLISGWYEIYRQISNIRRTLVGNKIIDHSDVVGASPVGAAATTSSFSTCSFNGLGKHNCKTRQETFKFWDLVTL